jgi:hypothetical protein
LAYLDDLYVISAPARTVPIFHLLETHLRAHAGISLHLGKTRIWNAAGEEPTDAHTLQPAAQAEPIWTGAWTLPAAEQGLKALGTPIGHPDYVAAALTAKRASHDRLLDAIPSVSDTQVAFLLLLQCACPRANMGQLPLARPPAFPNRRIRTGARYRHRRVPCPHPHRRNTPSPPSPTARPPRPRRRRPRLTIGSC